MNDEEVWMRAWEARTVGMIALNYERITPAEQAFAKYDFKHEISNPSPWKVAERSSKPADTLMRTVSLTWNEREYHRVFAVVFHPGSCEIAEVLFGDMLP